MTAKSNLDDLEAVRIVVDALKDFQTDDQERILRWAREKLGLSNSPSRATPIHTAIDDATPQQPPARADGVALNIKSFVRDKGPKSDSQFAAVVAYYYQFEASAGERKTSINGEDLQEACRKADWERLKKPAQTLVNAYNQGYFDKAGERGSYALNAVGENLVAMALPEGVTSTRTSKPKRGSRTAKRPSRRKG